jgi:hypothetical protein
MRKFRITIVFRRGPWPDPARISSSDRPATTLITLRFMLSVSQTCDHSGSLLSSSMPSSLAV